MDLSADTGFTRRALFMTAASLSLPGWAQGLSRDSIRLVLPVPPGGPVDNIGRLIATKMEAELKVPLVFDYKPGAGGMVAASAAAQARADGNTLFYTLGSTYTMVPHLSPVPVNMLRDFVPVSGVFRATIVMLINANVRARTLAEFVELSSGKRTTYASAGIGTSPHLMAEMLKARLNFKADHIPYKGGAEMQRALIGGEVDFAFDTLSTSLGNITSGRLRALAVASEKRVPELASVPTLQETGVDLAMYTWAALLAPKGTPAALVKRLNQAVKSALSDEQVKVALSQMSAEPQYTTPEDLQRLAERESESWRALILKLGIKPQ